ncbi:MAG: ribosome small subunit-dependent GTPase A [Caldilineaceae bacterium]|nr:ribosome small subunit-dependent GTPase A [Caldilineaceae bacterium]
MARRQKFRTTDMYEEYEDIDEAYWDRRSSKPKPKKASADLISGVVLRSLGHHYEVRTSVEDEYGVRHHVRLCEVRGRLLQERTKDTLIAAGDRVMIKPHGADKGLIEEVEPRQSVLSRQQPGVNVPAEDVILANPDQALIVFAVTRPDPHLRMLDRFLVIAEANLLPTIICVNKIDLVDIDYAKQIFSPYEKIGYRVIYASAEDSLGLEELEAILTDRITVVTGPSGVGKSSLINALHPGLALDIGNLRDFMNKGKHTTRTAQLLPLPFGAWTYIADTPGIRELGLYDIEPDELGFYFREFAPYIHNCRFPDCTHDHEPGCAVRAAVEAGDIHPERYESYLRLLRGEEEE